METIQWRKLFKGRNYRRKYGISYVLTYGNYVNTFLKFKRVPSSLTKAVHFWKYLLLNNSKNTYQNHKNDTQSKKQGHSVYHHHYENE